MGRERDTGKGGCCSEGVRVHRQCMLGRGRMERMLLPCCRKERAPNKWGNNPDFLCRDAFPAVYQAWRWGKAA